jgi:NF-kappa-B-activating protein C-terminal domain
MPVDIEHEPKENQDLTTIPAQGAETGSTNIAKNDNNNSDDDSVGPQLPPVSGNGDASQSNALDPALLTASGGKASYGSALLPGEGQALASFVQQNVRIPRRGEIGYSADAIAHYEASGYVMSGSRHTRMNAVRLRKENQVYSAEEQRALALLQREEQQLKEAALIQEWKTLLTQGKSAQQQEQP